MKSYSLFKVGDAWHFRFKVAGRPRVQRSTHETNRTKADQVASQAFDEALKRSRGDEPCPTVGVLADLWAQTHGPTASASHLRSVATFRRMHLYELELMTLEEVHTQHVEDARAQYLQTHAPTSANQWLNILRMLFNWAIRRRMIKVREWQVKVLRVQRKPKVLLSPSDTTPWLAAVDQVASQAMRTVIRLALGLGLREMEAARARWEWVDWDARVYRPGQTKGKEAKPRPIPAWLLEHLRSLQRPLGHPKEGWIAPLPDGAPYEAGRMRRVMAQANAKVGIKGLTPHRLRGSYITYLLAAKVPLQDVQQAVGHADVRTTLGYAEVDLDRVRLGQDEIAARAGMLGRRNGAAHPAKPAAARVAR